MRSRLATCLITVCTLVVSATARQTSPGGGSAIDPALQRRALEYWQRRQAKDLTNAYPFYCAEYRARVPLAQYLQQTRLVRFDLTDVHVSGAEPDGPRMKVRIGYRFLVPSLPQPEQSGQTMESWARGADGLWCKEDEPLVVPFPVTSPAAPKP